VGERKAEIGMSKEEVGVRTSEKMPLLDKRLPEKGSQQEDQETQEKVG